MIKTTRLKEPQIPDIELEIEELVEGLIEVEAQERAAADGRLQNQIDELKNSPDVVDIVNTKADLDAYDTSKLGENAIIRVLEDETHENKSAFYRWVGGVWEFIGTAESGDTKSVELTQAEYDALPDEEKMNGTIYFITDGQGGEGKTYSSGNGILVDNINDTISADTTVLATKDDIPNEINDTDWSALWQ